MSIMSHNVFNISMRDTALLIVPQFHVMAWRGVVVMQEIPKTSVGKPNKKALWKLYQEGELKPGI